MQGQNVEALRFPDRVALLEQAQGIIEHKFENLRLLELALTHPSASDPEELDSNYERLEFLGDSVLGAIVAVEIYSRFADLDEGGMTRIKVSIVAGSTLSQVAADQGLADVIIFGESEAGTRGRGLHSALENVYEAIVAALYLDGGIEVARRWVLRTLGPHFNRDIAMEPESPKSSLQELLQAQHRKPVYKIVGVDGPPHERIFHAQVWVDERVFGKGSGRSKKEAEVAAARKALARLGATREQG